MREFIIGLWYTLLWRGGLSVTFGVCAFVSPGNFFVEGYKQPEVRIDFIFHPGRAFLDRCINNLPYATRHK